MLLDVIPAVPSAAVIPVVFDIVHAGIVSVPRAIIMINAMVLAAPPVPATAAALMVGSQVWSVYCLTCRRHVFIKLRCRLIIIMEWVY